MYGRGPDKRRWVRLGRRPRRGGLVQPATWSRWAGHGGLVQPATWSRWAGHGGPVQPATWTRCAGHGGLVQPATWSRCAGHGGLVQPALVRVPWLPGPGREACSWVGVRVSIRGPASESASESQYSTRSQHLGAGGLWLESGESGSLAWLAAGSWSRGAGREEGRERGAEGSEDALTLGENSTVVFP
jgi:hypothetical protein